MTATTLGAIGGAKSLNQYIAITRLVKLALFPYRIPNPDHMHVFLRQKIIDMPFEFFGR